MINKSGDELETEEPNYGKKEERVGRRIPAKEVLAYGDSLFVNPPSENRCTIKLVNILTVFHKVYVRIKVKILPQEQEKQDAAAPVPSPKASTQRGEGPQFQSRPLVPDTINPYLARYRVAEDRSHVRARVLAKSQPLVRVYNLQHPVSNVVSYISYQ